MKGRHLKFISLNLFFLTNVACLIYKGCYIDLNARDLNFYAYNTINDLTIEKCALKCKILGYIYMGVQSR